MPPQTHQYDKILRENIEAALPGLIKNLLHIDILDSEELPDDIQHTKERKPDVLKKIRDHNQHTSILHIEFQVKNEPEMVFRMAEYYIMLVRKYKIAVTQYVIYIGKGIPKMKDHFHSDTMSFKYQLIPISSIDYHLFLQSDHPEEKLLAILADFGNDPAELAVENIAKQVVKASKGDFDTKRHLKQLRILATLRNLAPEKLLIMDSLEGVFTVENDIFYRIGEYKGGLKAVNREKKAFVTNLLLKTDFSIARIADLVGVTQYYVKKVKKSLN